MADIKKINGKIIKDEIARNLIGELQTQINDIETSGGSNINDTSASATTTYSSNKIESIKENLSSQIEEIMGSGIVGKSKAQSYPCPVIYLDGDTTDMTKENAILMDILIIDEYGDIIFQGKSNTSWQGSGSLQYPNKNLSLKLKDKDGNKKKLKIYDYETSTYHLKCNYADYSMVRNSVGARMIWDFDNTTFPTNALITVKSKPVIMYLNGEFNGCYTLNLKQDDDLFGMDSKTNPLTNIVYRSGLGNLVLSNFEYRSDGVETPEIQAKLTTLLDFIKNSSDDDFKLHFNEHLDLGNAINYWIFADLACATDSTINNWTLATWDGNKWYMCWYDLDIIFGLFRNAGISYHPSNPTTDLLNCQYTKINPIWEKLYNNFFDEIKTRYWELRNNGVINASRIVNQFRSFQSIWGTENITKERSKWSDRINKTDDIDMMHSWITSRISYLDDKYNSIPCTGISLNKTNLTLNNTTKTATLIATLTPSDTTNTVTWSSLPEGIVTVNNGLVTAINNGETIITASCGGHSSTCNVTVSGIVPVFGITYSIENATMSNSVASIEKGASYTSTITANKGYEIATVTVTMDGTDITSTVLSGNTINIPNVTGNITINVKTMDSSILENYIPVILTGEESWRIPEGITTTGDTIAFELADWCEMPYTSNSEPADLICDFPVLAYDSRNNDINKESIFIAKDRDNIYLIIRINKNKLSTQDVGGFKAYLQENPMQIMVGVSSCNKFIIDGSQTFVDKCSESWAISGNVSAGEIDIKSISSGVNKLYVYKNNKIELQPNFIQKNVDKYNTYLSTTTTLAFIGVHVKADLLSERTLEALKTYLQENPITVYFN